MSVDTQVLSDGVDQVVADAPEQPNGPIPIPSSGSVSMDRTQVSEVPEAPREHLGAEATPRTRTRRGRISGPPSSLVKGYILAW